MSQLLLKIKDLVESLPLKDIKFARKFLKERRFRDLRDLVNSDIYKADRNLDQEGPDIYKLNLLRYYIECYMSYLDEPQEDDYYD